MKKRILLGCAATLLAVGLTSSVRASSHMDAPTITLDPAANTCDVYAFRSAQNGVQYLTTALTVYPFEEPGIGPNLFTFGPGVLYEIHLSLGADVAAGKPTISYQFKFKLTHKNANTVLAAYLGPIQNVNDAGQNLVQTYTVTRVDHRPANKRPAGRAATTVLGNGVVPPNNQGIATPLYNQDNNGENPAKGGVDAVGNLDPYTTQTVQNLTDFYTSFCGQRDDGFYGDIQAVFDLLNVRSPGKDAQGGFNVHMIALNIPLSDIGGDQQAVGVYCTTSRQAVRVLRDNNLQAPGTDGAFIQIGREGNPLFCETLVAVADKDLYNRTTPAQDTALFKKYAQTPELAKLLNQIVFHSTEAPESNRTDLVGIFIPDLIRVDLSTGPCRLAGGTNSAFVSDDQGFSRLSIFGNDTLTSTVQAGFGNGVVPGGWPNGRRFGDDVVDIALTAVASDLRTSPPMIHATVSDNVDNNDMTYNKVFPYAATPQNGRNHTHP